MTADEIVRIELDADPLDRGYEAMSDLEVCQSLTAAVRESWVPVSASAILEAIVPAAWAGLSDTARADVDSVLSMGGVIDISPGSNARALLVAAFADSGPTLTALAAVAKRMISRAAEIGCSCNEFIVAAARALP